MSIREDNYAVIQGWMLSKLGLKGNELLIYAIIYGFSQTDGQVFSGGLRYLSEWTNSTKQGVIKNIKSLIEKGYIEKREKIVNGVKFCEYYTTELNGVVNKVEWGGKQSLMGGIKQSLPNNININNKDNKINKKELESEFTELWNEYPRKQGKENALKAYIKARTGGIDKSIILNGIKAYKAFLKANKTDSKYIKQGSTWFNQHCWEDDYNIGQAAKVDNAEDDDLDFLKGDWE